MMKKILVLMICAALCLSLIPAASADGVILWERLDTGDVIAMTRQPTEEELKNLKLHTHSYGDWVVITQASCSEAGLRYRICSKCGYKDTETIGKTEHSFMWIVTVREATCTSEGYGYQKCARCGYMQEYVIPRVPHSYGGWSTVKETTDHSAGIRQRSCYVCGFIQSESFDPPGTLRRGSQGSSVREMQALLSQQGYLASGYVDGDFGYYTEKAVMDFQKAINITADGVAWPQTLNLLHHKFGEWKVVREPDYYSVALLERVCEDCGYKESKEIGVMLQLGDYNENVKTLQKRLNALGYDVGYPDGLFGDGTKRAVKNYEKAQGFEEDGIVWPGVWTALFPEDLSDLPAKTEKN